MKSSSNTADDCMGWFTIYKESTYLRQLLSMHNDEQVQLPLTHTETSKMSNSSDCNISSQSV